MKHNTMKTIIFSFCLFILSSCKVYKIEILENGNKQVNLFKNNRLLKSEDFSPEGLLLKTCQYFYFSCKNCNSVSHYLNSNKQIDSKKLSNEYIKIEITYHKSELKKTLSIHYNNSYIIQFYEWDEDGNLIKEGQYGVNPKREYSPNYIMNNNIVEVVPLYQIKNGIWNYYNTSGNLILIEVYDNGVLIKSEKLNFEEK
jgi:antitoxin component YwqK of YwqJK toxin-antitoxin module